ncbi:MAG TPA: ATP-binding protein, partial [Bryobacteraceae bacterium]
MQSNEIDRITADLLHAAVHDLRGPANRLRLLAQLLRREANALDEDSGKLLDHIEDSAAAVSGVAEGLRNYVEICTRPLCREPLDLNRSLASAIASLRAEIESAGGQVTSFTLPEVQADPFLMAWLLQELLTNAIRFRMADPPRVHISSGSGGPGDWFVSVADNGPGIEAGMAERVFRPFKKVSAGPGAGLGLTICRKIVEMHGGQIWLEPREGGADFRFFLDGAPPQAGR